MSEIFCTPCTNRVREKTRPVRCPYQQYEIHTDHSGMWTNPSWTLLVLIWNLVYSVRRLSPPACHVNSLLIDMFPKHRISFYLPWVFANRDDFEKARSERWNIYHHVRGQG